MKRTSPIAIVSLADDPHALAVRALLRQRFARECDIVAVDRLADSGGLHWRDGARVAARLPALHGGVVDVPALAALWWRRAGAPAALPPAVTDPKAMAQVTDDCLNALGSLLRADFHGAWVNHPDATRHAELKLLQLRAARELGLTVPATLISQSPQDIRAFYAECGGNVIVKPLTTRVHAGVAAGRLTPELLRDDAVLRLSPAIYQALVPGTQHLRVHVLGDRALAALIEAGELDWRFHLRQTRFSPYVLSESLRRPLVAMLDRLGLRMGVFDLKLAPDGTPMWLEVNPQGQFLFVEALGGLPLTAAMAEFLDAEARAPMDVAPARCA